MNKTAKLDMSFSVYVYTCIPEANTFLDDQIDELSLFPDNDEFTHFFGEDASKIDGLYQEAHSNQLNAVKAAIDRELQLNFDVYCIGNECKLPLYIYSDTRNTLLLCSAINYEVGFEVANEPGVRVVGKYIQELSKMLKATFDNLNEDFGIEAKFGDIAF